MRDRIKPYPSVAVKPTVSLYKNNLYKNDLYKLFYFTVSLLDIGRKGEQLELTTKSV